MTQSTTQTIVQEVKEDVAAYPPAQASPVTLYEHPQEAETTDTPLRFLGYAARFRTLAITGSRYLAYTSDVGEAFRPVVNRNLVTAAYGISFAYVGFDVAFEGYKARQRGADALETTRVVAERGLFQGLASLLFPALTIHTVVDLTGKALKNKPKTPVVRWTPTVAGLLVVPFLPIMFDHPLEHIIAKTFDTVWPMENQHKNKEKTH
ncbi:mitochondrial 18 KDa protein-domain-containing protein [Powellomyces hirtus]|nr:mitochondrial 18 KDa protein-domain-containing protein [Powellomyces hirtus]KAI8917903.1 mitochondrial 18 KDa protein-domain-containing protein [Powellomyces hirtus]